jgi:transcriptional regulator with XRE-family HTH domain
MAAAAVLQPALDPAALRHARRAAGLTLADVGQVTGRTLSVVARYERGKIDPPASVLATLAGLYRVGVGSFFTSTDQ